MRFGNWMRFARREPSQTRSLNRPSRACYPRRRGVCLRRWVALFVSIEEWCKRENIWATALHLSPLLGYLIPVAGLVVPVVLWQMKKESPLIDRHGRAVMNWILSQIIWWGISAVLCLVLVGIPMLWVMGILVVVFPIIGAVRAYEGRVWSYPLCFRFFREM